MATTCAFLHSMVVGRLLGASVFGLIAVNASYTTLVFQLVELRLHESVVRYATEYSEAHDGRRLKALANLSLLVDLSAGITAFALVVGLAPRLCALSLLPTGVSGRLLVLSATQVFFTNVSSATSMALLRVLDRFRVVALITMASMFTRLAGTIIGLKFFHWGAESVVAFASLTAAAGTVTLLLMARRRLEARLPAEGPAPIGLLRPRAREMVRFTATTYLLSLASIPQRDLDVTILARTTPLSEVGTYRVAKNFMSGVWAICDPILFAVYPEVARYWTRRDFLGLRRFIRRLTATFAFGGLAMVAAAWLLVPWVIRHMMGVGFIDAGMYFHAMVWGALTWIPLLWLTPLMLASGRPDVTLRASLISGALGLICYVLLIPRWGAMAASLITAMNTVVVVGAGVLLAWTSGVLPRVWRSKGET